MKDYLILFAFSVLMLAAGGGVAMLIYGVVAWLGGQWRCPRPGTDPSGDDGPEPGFGHGKPKDRTREGRVSGSAEGASVERSPIRINGEEAGQTGRRPFRRFLTLAV